MSRIALRAMGLLVVVPALLVVYLFRGQLGGRELPLLLGLLLALLGAHLVWTLVRTMQELQSGLLRVSRGEAGEIVLDRPPDQIREMAEIINALNRLTVEFRENAAQLERFIHQFAVLTELTEVTARVPEIQDLLELVLQKAMCSTRAQRGVTLLWREQEDALDMVCSVGWSEEDPPPRELLERLARQVSDVGRPVRWGSVDGSPGNVPVPAAEGAGDPILAVPLRTKAGVVGVLCLTGKPGGGFHEDEQFMTVLLAQIGFAVENARLLQHARDAARNLQQKVRHQEMQIQDAEQRILRSERLWALGQLAGGIAHDFNNLLQAILGFLDLGLRDTSPGDPPHAFVEQARHATQRAILMARELLAFGRRQELSTQDLDLNRVVSEFLRMVTVVLGRRYRLEQQSVSEPLPVHVDPRQIEHVLMNLCLNARDAMPQGGTIEVSTGMVELEGDAPMVSGGVAAGRYALVRVSDTGVGMSRKTMEQVFEPLFTTKPAGSGTGLGLATAYGIVRQHGGFIDVTSEEGKGSTFTIYLPDARGAALARAA